MSIDVTVCVNSMAGSKLNKCTTWYLHFSPWRIRDVVLCIPMCFNSPLVFYPGKLMRIGGSRGIRLWCNKCNWDTSQFGSHTANREFILCFAHTFRSCAFLFSLLQCHNGVAPTRNRVWDTTRLSKTTRDRVNTNPNHQHPNWRDRNKYTKWSLWNYPWTCCGPLRRCRRRSPCRLWAPANASLTMIPSWAMPMNFGQLTMRRRTTSCPVSWIRHSVFIK